MSDPEITFEVFTLEPEDFSDGESSAVSDDAALPEGFEGYHRSRQTLMVMAVNREGIVVGTGGGWLYEHADKPPLLWVKAAEVNEPFQGTNLPQALICVLLKAAEEKGITGAYLSEDLQADDAPDESTVPEGSGSDPDDT